MADPTIDPRQALWLHGAFLSLGTAAPILAHGALRLASHERLRPALQCGLLALSCGMVATGLALAPELPAVAPGLLRIAAYVAVVLGCFALADAIVGRRRGARAAAVVGALAALAVLAVLPSPIPGPLVAWIGPIVAARAWVDWLCGGGDDEGRRGAALLAALALSLSVALLAWGLRHDLEARYAQCARSPGAGARCDLERLGPERSVPSAAGDGSQDRASASGRRPGAGAPPPKDAAEVARNGQVAGSAPGREPAGRTVPGSAGASPIAEQALPAAPGRGVGVEGRAGDEPGARAGSDSAGSRTADGVGGPDRRSGRDRAARLADEAGTESTTIGGANEAAGAGREVRAARPSGRGDAAVAIPAPGPGDAAGGGGRAGTPAQGAGGAGGTRAGSGLGQGAGAGGAGGPGAGGAAAVSGGAGAGSGGTGAGGGGFARGPGGAATAEPAARWGAAPGGSGVSRAGDAAAPPAARGTDDVFPGALAPRTGVPQGDAGARHSRSGGGPPTSGDRAGESGLDALAAVVPPTRPDSASRSSRPARDPASGPRPQPRASLSLPLAGRARDLELRGDLVFVAGWTSGLLVAREVDGEVAMIGRLQTPGIAAGVALAGRHVVVADYSTLRVVDVTRPAQPRSLAALGLPGVVLDVEVTGHRAFVAAWQAGLHVVDVSDPSAPRLVSSLPLAGHASDVEVQDGLAFVAAGEAGCAIVDVRGPAPRLVAVVEDAGAIRGVGVAGARLWLAGYGTGVHVYDVSDPTAPVPLVRHAEPATAHDIEVDESAALVSAGRLGVWVVGLEGQGRARWLAAQLHSSATLAAKRHGPQLYLANDHSGVVAYVLREGADGSLAIE